jgi:regulator of RNase E activity RraA
MYEREDLEEFCGRYSALYTGAIADVLDDLGHRRTVLPTDIRPLVQGTTLAGPAFTVRGRAIYGESAVDPRYKQMDMLESIPPNSVVLFDAGGETASAHWGELMSAVARGQGARGAMVNGGLRDTRQIRSTGFPVFGRFQSPYTAVWRFEITEFQLPLTLNGVTVQPGDMLLGDDDGIVSVPQKIADEVLVEAETIAVKERTVYEELSRGGSIRSLFEEYQVF